MADQSMLQSFIQNTAGTQTAAQANTPTAVNNGNPNTAYNWTSYLPTVTQQPGALPNVNFDLLTSQAPASSPGYTPPFTADPYAAMVMAGMPRATTNENVTRILNRFLGGGSGGGFTPNPGTGTPGTPGPGTGTPGTPTGPNPGGTYNPGVGTPVGPISGPIAQNPHNWASNYANAQPNTNLREGGNGAWNNPWMLTPAFQSAMNGPSTGNSIFDGLGAALRGISNTVGGLISREASAFMDDARNFLDDVTLQNGGAGLLRQALNVFGLPGLGNLIPRQAEETFNLTPQQEAAITEKLNSQLSAMMNKIKENGGEAALQRLANLQPQNNSALNYYNNAPQMSNRQWNQTLDRAGFINMFESGQAHTVGSQLLRDLQARFAQVAQVRPRKVTF